MLLLLNYIYSFKTNNPASVYQQYLARPSRILLIMVYGNDDHRRINNKTAETERASLAEISAHLNVSHKVKMEGACSSGEFPYKG